MKNEIKVNLQSHDVNVWHIFNEISIFSTVFLKCMSEMKNETPKTKGKGVDVGKEKRHELAKLYTRALKFHFVWNYRGNYSNRV